MMHALVSVNYVTVIVVTVVGFLFGWLWHSPVLFGKAWMAEMKITEDKMKEMAQKSMAPFFIKSLIYTLISTYGLAVLLGAHGSHGWLAGLKLGAFVGLVLIGARLLNAAVWEQRSCKLSVINLGHEACLFALQGAILAAWVR
ncbi:MAG: DUF1761 domain-containing protein [Opitutales bacterium]